MLRSDVEMICGAAKVTGGEYFNEVGPYIAQRMKTDLLIDVFATVGTTTTLDMIAERIRSAMVRTNVQRCHTLDILLQHDPRKRNGD